MILELILMLLISHFGSKWAANRICHELRDFDVDIDQLYYHIFGILVLLSGTIFTIEQIMK